jgi:hypothetical protein
MRGWIAVASELPASFWPMWVVTAQEPETPAVGWYDGCDWWIFIDGHGPECQPETVTRWQIMTSPAVLPIKENR